MSTDDEQKPQDTNAADDKAGSAGAELREGLRHLFSAARKLVKSAEPTVSRSLEDAERVITKIGRGGEVVAAEVSREVASLASKLADKLQKLSDRHDERRQEDPASPQTNTAPSTEDPPKDAT